MRLVSEIRNESCYVIRGEQSLYLYTSPYVIWSRDHIVELSLLKLSFKSLARNVRQHFIIHIFQGAF